MKSISKYPIDFFFFCQQSFFVYIFEIILQKSSSFDPIDPAIKLLDYQIQSSIISDSIFVSQIDLVKKLALHSIRPITYHSFCI
jgi:hypothetical protein